MDSKEKLNLLRQDIDLLDEDIVRLFLRRMDISDDVARVKAEGNIAVTDEGREQAVIDKALSVAGQKDNAEIIAFMHALMALSKLRQNKKLMLSDPVSLPHPVPLRSNDITVAFQGVDGAWSQIGAEELFPAAALQATDYFEDVFDAVISGKADYGVLPIENSQTGAIGEVYDLLRRYGCFIIGEFWVPIAHCLLGIPGAKLSDIREVFSHPEGFSQCHRFLKNRSWDLTACRNTAYAAQKVQKSNDKRFAAIGSRRAAQVHSLDVLAPDIMDDPANCTRFIAIAAAPVYDDKSGTTSITFSTAHKSGALCAVLQSLMLAGINLKRIESRPASSGKYRFFADLEANIMSDTTLGALRQAAMHCDYFEVLGCYGSVPR